MRKEVLPAGGNPARAQLLEVVDRRRDSENHNRPQQRQQQLTARLHLLGSRVLYEFIDELARHHPEIAEDLNSRLERYASLDSRTLRLVGGDRFPPPPIWQVSQR